MKLWKISQSVNYDYDTYDSAIVAAETEDEARMIHPEGKLDRHQPSVWDSGRYSWIYRIYSSEFRDTSWAPPSDVTVELIGTAKPGTKAGVILASFNAG